MHWHLFYCPAAQQCWQGLALPVPAAGCREAAVWRASPGASGLCSTVCPATRAASELPKGWHKLVTSSTTALLAVPRISKQTRETYFSTVKSAAKLCSCHSRQVLFFFLPLLYNPIVYNCPDPRYHSFWRHFTAVLVFKHPAHSQQVRIQLC